VGTVGYAAGLINNGASFPGSLTTNFLQRPSNDTILDLGVALAPFTVQAWIDADDPTSNDIIVEKGNASTQGWHIQISTAGAVLWAQPGVVTNGTSVGLITAGAGMQHIVVTSDGATTKIYVDNVEAASFASQATVASTNALRVGNRAVLNQPFDGIIDELAIWTRVVNAAEVNALYNAGAGKLLTLPTGLPTTPTISGNTIINFASDNGHTLYSVVLNVGAVGVDIGEGDVGLLIADLI